MNAQEFVLMQIEWLQAQYENAQDNDLRERIISAIEGIVCNAITDNVYPKPYSSKVE